MATGATSREAASQLFLTHHTIEAHLSNIVRKLDITSRRQLKEDPGAVAGRNSLQEPA